ncbi:aromatic amino acid DMT transporter YddG [Pseudomonas sp. 5P_3.1_Bac2]|uniref:aromatic amino acid DMT transporter YddG n=1 Tax=Pseudomonas sp. 5P_3.1_Bac2 TaxID=2971617 RepID=UPI0021C99779|nr:aromatic amino acid DMT transporter YddG [Pseudomonas sp. 5P_3.1_Bac2]MCU1717279.1 aromatic amino acid DMT transporter YddG [Pseudomonas sp. 5P_3.1_Bac2]
MLNSSGRAATLCGVVALLVWSTASGLIRSTSQYFGPIGGAALIYSFGAVLLFVLLGRPRLRHSSRLYLVLGTALFVTYEICLSLALGYANSSEQAIQVSVVNSLWPCLTVLLAVPMNQQSARWFILPGTALALWGTTWVVSTDGLSLASFVSNIKSNPLSYGMAATCAITFALYCNITRRYARGENHVGFFFAVTAILLWVKYALSSEALPAFTLQPSLELACLVLSMAGGYALWNVGILRGNLTLLATLSYFSPVLSAAFSALWLGASLSLQFWHGALLVTFGSLICWYATRTQAKAG